MPRAYEVLSNRMYVDDICHSERSVQGAKETIHEVDEVLRKGSFETKGWHSNHPEVDQILDEMTTGVLGDVWYRFALKHKEISQLSVYLKRNIMSTIAKLWDPIGLLLPVTFKYRIWFQDHWKRGHEWDEPSREEEADIWRGCVCEMVPLFDSAWDAS